MHSGKTYIRHLFRYGQFDVDSLSSCQVRIGLFGEHTMLNFVFIRLSICAVFTHKKLKTNSV